ncbi:MAG: plastocyanin/azurin family copper-binding protein [Chloroflexota bacterium]|jgi:plastocyanin
MYRKTIFIIMAILALSLAACSGGDAAEEVVAEQSITVDMHDIYFGPDNDNAQNPPEWTVSSGAEITVNMENMGALEHSWVVLKQGEEIPANYDEAADAGKVLFSSGNVAAGAGEAVRFTAPAAGEYNVLCAVPGHGAIMQGRLIVTG